MRLCSVEGCTRKHKARGYCANHYEQATYHGTCTQRTCTVEGCIREHHAKGYCHFHYEKFCRREYNRTHAYNRLHKPRADGLTCTMCDRPIYTHKSMLCYRHYQYDRNHTPRKDNLTCLMCDKLIHTRKSMLCQRHYLRQRLAAIKLSW